MIRILQSPLVGLFYIAAYLGIPFFIPSLLYSQDMDNRGVVSGDSLTTYTNPFNSELNLFIRFIIALAIVIILLILTLWVLKHIMRLRVSGIADESLDVIAIRYIEPKKAVVLIRVLKRVLIVGISDNSISTLGELSSEEIGSLQLDKKTEPGVFGNILPNFFRKKSL
ncbi:MAG TPA: hypothetical protein ENH82_04685 [bacterium]|nr:hypothetical protein [bacterium]